MMQKIGLWLWQDFDSVDSTNSSAFELCNKVNQPCVVTAREQHKGRGRRGRNWISYKDNLFMSFAYPVAIDKLGHMVILSGLAVLMTVRHFCPNIRVNVKWPNDVLVEGAKISGILFEKGPDDFWIMGIGINIVAHPQQNEAGYETTGMNYIGANTTRLEDFRVFVDIWHKLMEEYSEYGFQKLRQAWLDNAFKLGQKIIIRQEKCNKEGIFKGIDEYGSLILEQDHQEIKILTGDVFA